MSNEHDNVALLHPELGGGEFIENDSFSEARLPERQYCVFRAGRERFCFSVLEVEEVVDWPIVTRVRRPSASARSSTCRFPRR